LIQRYNGGDGRDDGAKAEKPAKAPAKDAKAK
jgi:hypothetical protein